MYFISVVQKCIRPQEQLREPAARAQCFGGSFERMESEKKIEGADK